MTHHDARTAFREAVAAVAAKARAKLPACAGHLDSAVKLVLAGDVELLAEGGARVASRYGRPCSITRSTGTVTARPSRGRPKAVSAQTGLRHRPPRHELVPMSPPALPEPSVEPRVLAAPAPTRERAGMRLEAQVVIEGVR